MKCAIFDLDGTLLNTIDDLADACNELLEKYNFKANWTIDDYKSFVGWGAAELVKHSFNNTLTDEQLAEVLVDFKDIYNKHKQIKTKPYDGIIEQLDILKQKGIKLCVVTNKPQFAAVDVVDYYFGKGYFDFVIGPDENTPIKPDPTTTKMALEYCGCKPSEAIYFGDSDIDMITAHNADVEAVGVTWGFRSFQQLFQCNPSVIIDEPKYISKLF